MLELLGRGGWTGGGNEVHVHPSVRASTRARTRAHTDLTFLSSSSENSCGDVVFLQGAYLNPSARSDVYLLIPPRSFFNGVCSAWK